MLGTKILEERESKFNGHLVVSKSLGFGTYIQSDGLTQSGGIVEAIWRQTLRQVKAKKPVIKNVLILGLGGGTAAKLVKKNWKDVKITGIEIDPIMIELGEKHLGLNKSDVEIRIADAFKELKNIKSKYDLIIVDLYSGDQFPKQFETENYIHLVRLHLANGGLAVFNRLYYGDKRPEAVKFGNKLKIYFKDIKWFYPEANLMFVCTI